MAERYFYSYLCSSIFGACVEHHTVMLRCLPMRTPSQLILQETLTPPPGYWHHESTDALGNRTLLCGRRDAHPSLVYQSTGVVELTGAPVAEPSPAPFYRYATPLTTLPPQVCARAAGLSPEQICSLVHAHIAYAPGATTAITTAAEAWEMRRGVCQDLAHAMTALCRSAGMPARYVAGLLEGEGATHAWVEVWRRGEWLPFDPTHDAPATAGYVKLAHGRDAAGCPVSRGIYRFTQPQPQQPQPPQPERPLVRALVLKV